MTRSIIIAILAFGLLILTNIAIFAHLIFGDLSESWIRERLQQRLREAEAIVMREASATSDTRELSRNLAPRLGKLIYFRAVLVVSKDGKVLHRESLSGHRIVQPATAERPNNDRLPRMVNVGNAQGALPDDTQLVLEYDPTRIEAELSMLRNEVNKKLWIAIGLSLILLLIGAGYVVWAYKRNKMLQKQAQKADRMAYVGTLASGLAHEIRNPLNSMNMNVQLIQEELLEQQDNGDVPELYNMLDATRKEILRLERLVSSFLMFARPTQLQTQSLQLNELLADTLKFLEPEIIKADIELQTQFENQLPKVDVDENQFRQALLNIIQNGIQVLQPKKRLQITTQKQNGNRVAIVVRDEGPGISQEEQKSIFKVFYSTRRGGTGLGLPIAQRIVELHRGDIKVDSNPGEGTMFTISLPSSANASA